MDPTGAQTQHEHAAAQNRAFSASVNHGRPAIGATSHPANFAGAGVVRTRNAAPNPTHNVQHQTAAQPTLHSRMPKAAARPMAPRPITRRRRLIPAASRQAANSVAENVAAENVAAAITAVAATVPKSNAERASAAKQRRKKAARR